jgi:LAO/AO transport system kinase
VILIETVGVGQSETAVHAMTDFFLLLMLAGAGDQLQGIKRGIMEMCDGMLITKSDGDNIKKAMAAKAEYSSALHLFPSRENGWTPLVDVVSSIGETGIDKAWNMITQFVDWQKARGIFDTNRQQQDINWMHQDIRDRLISEFYNSEENKRQISEAEELVKEGKMTAFDAASRVLGKKL